MLKVSTGFYKGRVLKSAKNPVVRPTMAKVKLSLFDILQSEIREKIFLDGFAGTGNMGIEALSRGAEYVIFIDDLPEAAATIRHNLDKIGIPSDRYRVIRGDFNRSIIALAQDNFKFDIIYLDPPFAYLEYANPLKVIHKRQVLKPDGLIIQERPERLKFYTPYFEVVRTQTLSGKSLDFFRYGAEKTSP